MSKTLFHLPFQFCCLKVPYKTSESLAKADVSKESKERVIKIDQTVKFNVFRMLLDYIYTNEDKITESSKTLDYLELFILADCYGLVDLCDVASKNVEILMTIENACLVLINSEE